MDTEDLIQKLDYIKSTIENKKYDDAIDLIENVKYELLAQQDKASEYIENLIDDLK